MPKPENLDGEGKRSFADIYGPNPYYDRLGPIALARFGNDFDMAEPGEIDTSAGSLVGEMLKRIGSA